MNASVSFAPKVPASLRKFVRGSVNGIDRDTVIARAKEAKRLTRLLREIGGDVTYTPDTTYVGDPESAGNLFWVWLFGNEDACPECLDARKGDLPGQLRAELLKAAERLTKAANALLPPGEQPDSRFEDDELTAEEAAKLPSYYLALVERDNPTKVVDCLGGETPKVFRPCGSDFAEMGANLHGFFRKIANKRTVYDIAVVATKPGKELAVYDATDLAAELENHEQPPEAWQLALVWPDQTVIKLVGDPVPNTPEGREAVCSEHRRFREKHEGTAARFLVVPAKLEAADESLEDTAAALADSPALFLRAGVLHAGERLVKYIGDAVPNTEAGRKIITAAMSDAMPTKPADLRYVVTPVECDGVTE